MADNQIPDFRPNRPIDIMAFVNALAEKRRAETANEQINMQKNAQKYQMLKDTVSSVTNMTQNIIDDNAAKQRATYRKELAELMAQGSDQVPTDEVKPAASTAGSKNLNSLMLNQAPVTTEFNKTPAYQSRVRSLLEKVNPEEMEKQLVKQASLESGVTKPLSGRDIRQMNLMLPNGKRMTVQLFETVPSQQYGTKVTWTNLQGDEIDPAELKGAVEAPMPGVAVDQFGNPIIFEKVGPDGARRIGTDVPTETSEKVKEEDPGNAYLRLFNKAPKLATDLKNSIKESTVDNPVVAARVDSVNASKYARGLLEDPKAKETELGSIYTYIARAVEKGALTEADKAAFSDALSIIARGENTFYKHLKGEAGPMFKTSLIRLQKRLELRGTSELNKKINTEKLLLKRQLGKLWEPGFDKMYPTVEDLTVSLGDMNPELFNDVPASENSIDPKVMLEKTKQNIKKEADFKFINGRLVPVRR